MGMKLLVCLDGTELSRSILPVARTFADALRAEVHLLHVINAGAVHETSARVPSLDPRPNVDSTGGPIRVGREYMTGSARLAKQAMVEDRDQALTRRENTVSDSLRVAAQGFAGEVQRVTRHGSNAAAAIIDYAATHHVDAIVMATHSRRRVAKLFVGSTTNAVIASGVAPVLVMHPTE